MERFILSLAPFIGSAPMASSQHDHLSMTPIPRGELWMGLDDGNDILADAKSVHRIRVHARCDPTRYFDPCSMFIKWTGNVDDGELETRNRSDHP
jgi:hypothetical protein